MSSVVAMMMGEGFGAAEWRKKAEEVAKEFDPVPVSVHPLREGGKTVFFQVLFKDSKSGMRFAYDMWLARSDPSRHKNYDCLRGCLAFTSTLDGAFMTEVVHSSGRIKDIVDMAENRLVEDGYIVRHISSGSYGYGPNERVGSESVAGYGGCLRGEE